MPVTIYDIAKKANTTAATVSMALRDNERISVSTRKKIKAMADELGYRPNPMARGLAGAKTKTFGFVFNFPAADFAKDAFYTEIFHLAAVQAAKHDYRCVLHCFATALSFEDVITDAKRHGVDGIVLASDVTDKKDVPELEKAPFPIVLLGREYYASNVGCLTYGNQNGIRAAIQHFVDCGHKRIVFAGKMKNENSREMFDGYKRYLREFDIEFDKDLVFECFWGMSEGKEVARKIMKMKNPPTAILAGTNMMAIGIMGELWKGGRRIPDDYSIIAYDNLEISACAIPPLTVVDLRTDMIAEYSINMLYDMIENNKQGIKIEIPSELVVRDSVRKI